MTNTIVVVAHPNSATSTSHQFLVQSGQQLLGDQVTYHQLESCLLDQGGQFDGAIERQRLMQYDRILFQFPLYWYQAPAILKQWMDLVFDESYLLKSKLKQKQFGLIVIAGVRASQYQPGGDVGVTMADLLSPYQALANYYQMVYLRPFTLHQLGQMNQADKHEAMIDYATYLLTGQSDDLEAKRQAHLIMLDHALQAKSLTDQQMKLIDVLKSALNSQAEELEELAILLRQV